MIIKNLVDEDFVNYKKPSLFILFPYCNFKCCKELGNDICQNSSLVKLSDINADANLICERYLNNPITKAIVMGGLEPLDSFKDVLEFVSTLRNKYSCDDDIVIYTGYKEEEVKDKIEELKLYRNIIIKFGRYIPNQKEHFDQVLGVNLASNNQYSVKIS